MEKLKVRRGIDRKEIEASDPLGEFFVWWDDITSEHVLSYEERLNSARREQDLQEYFESNPISLVQHLGGGHGRWVVPRVRLGAEYETDFVIGEKHSMGYEWCAVELESPLKKMFTKAGDPTKELTHAIRQIQDWRTWLVTNQNYAARQRDKNGLGLTDITPEVPGLILIGRRGSTPPETNARRRQMCADLSIKIHTFDFILDAARGRIPWIEKYRSAGNNRAP